MLTELLGDIFANWQANGDPLSGDDPHFNFVQVYHNSPRGLRQLQLSWPVIQKLYFIDNSKGTSTFTQPGNVTPAHIDGFGLTQLMAHLDGCKVWIVWPPIESNLRAIRDHDLAIGPNREYRLERWFEHLKDPQVFLIRKGESVFLGSSVIHACVSVTRSAHYGVFCWERDSLGVAELNVRILQDGFADLRKTRIEQKKIRVKEDKKKTVDPLELRKRKVDREQEDSEYAACSEFYKDCRKEWQDSDRRMWDSMNKDHFSNRLNIFLLNTDKFMGSIQ